LADPREGITNVFFAKGQPGMCENGRSRVGYFACSI